MISKSLNTHLRRISTASWDMPWTLHMTSSWLIVANCSVTKMNLHPKSGNNKLKARGGSSLKGNKIDANESESSKRELQLCLHVLHRARVIHIYIWDFYAGSDEVKKVIIKKLHDKRAKLGPAKSTRSQTANPRTKGEPSASSKRPVDLIAKSTLTG